MALLGTQFLFTGSRYVTEIVSIQRSKSLLTSGKKFAQLNIRNLDQRTAISTIMPKHHKNGVVKLHS